MDLVEIQDPVEKFEAMTNVAKAADAGPWDSIWVYDHFHTVPKTTMETTFECWTITATLARDTQRVKVGQMVTCNGYRHPALLAKIASTVDVASHGRLLCGLGAGWHEEEWNAYGFGGGFPETRERMGMFREAVEIIYKMWTEDAPVFQGKYYRIDKPVNEPKGAQMPHIPLWIGGGGEQVTLKLVAQYGDACNVGGSAENIRHKLDVLQRHCDKVGRNSSEIVKSSNLIIQFVDDGADREKETERARKATGQTYEEYSRNTLLGTPAMVVERIGQMVDAGVEYVIVNFPLVAYDHEPMQRFVEEVMPAFAGA
jgi:F420-dependent oxidoreductase-like protein